MRDLIFYDSLKSQNEYIRKNNLSDRKSVKTYYTNDRKISRLQAELIPVINTVDFVEPQCELRFGELDMDKIQQIKRHPIVKEVGKTSMSMASIIIG